MPRSFVSTVPAAVVPVPPITCDIFELTGSFCTEEYCNDLVKAEVDDLEYEKTGHR